MAKQDFSDPYINMDTCDIETLKELRDKLSRAIIKREITDPKNWICENGTITSITHDDKTNMTTVSIKSNGDKRPIITNKGFK